jgi:Cu/Ag efflux pump CusA
MLTLPSTPIGGVAAVFAAGDVVPLASVVGFVVLSEIATRSGVILITRVHQR